MKNTVIASIVLFAFALFTYADNPEQNLWVTLKSSKAKIAKAQYDNYSKKSSFEYDQMLGKLQLERNEKLRIEQGNLVKILDESMKEATQAGDLDEALKIREAKKIVNEMSILPTSAKIIKVTIRTSSDLTAVSIPGRDAKFLRHKVIAGECQVIPEGVDRYLIKCPHFGVVEFYYQLNTQQDSLAVTMQKGADGEVWTTIDLGKNSTYEFRSVPMSATYNVSLKR